MLEATQAAFHQAKLPFDSTWCWQHPFRTPGRIRLLPAAVGEPRLHLECPSLMLLGNLFNKLQKRALDSDGGFCQTETSRSTWPQLWRASWQPDIEGREQSSQTGIENTRAVPAKEPWGGRRMGCNGVLAQALEQESGVRGSWEVWRKQGLPLVTAWIPLHSRGGQCSVM